MKSTVLKIASALVLLSIIFSFTAYQASAAENDETQQIAGSSYEIKGNAKYSFEGLTPTGNMSYGQSSIGALSVSGEDLTKSSYNGKTAYGASSNVSFTYTFDTSLINTAVDEWHLVEDSEKKVAGQKLDSSILKGTLIIQKSYDGETYENAVNPVTNFFASAVSGKELYKSSGADLAQGVYYRFIFAYQTGIKDGRFLFWDQYEYKRHMEVYDFYVVENSGTISIHNLSVDEELLELEGYDQELLKHGETLLDNSITRDGFRIEKLASSYTVQVKRNSEPAKTVEDGAQFTQDGKYTVTVTTKLGKKLTTTIYVFSGGTDKGFSTYFGQSLVQAERVFREGDSPTYARGGRIVIQQTDSSVPVLYGILVDVETGDVVFELDGSHNEQTYSLNPGAYIAKFYNADPNTAGSYYQYNFAFTVIDEESAPYVNYHTLMSEQRLEDLQTKHYEVTYQTTNGGYIYVCFSLDSYEDALMYAREIEGRFVEEATDGGFYYKDPENPNRKIKYYDQLELTRVREQYAVKNVEIGYFNANDEFTYRTYDNNLLEQLESLNISKSIKVFPSQAEKEKLCDRAPYINDFTFIQASDYDVVSVEAQHLPTGEIITLEFDVPVKDQLSLSGEYAITETNSYGRTRKYTAFFITECDTVMSWVVSKDATEKTISVSVADCANLPIVIEADSAYVVDIQNPHDEWAIVTIKAPGVYSFEIKCLASEFKNLEFYKAGDYELSFVDRLGNSFVMTLRISGDVSYTDLKPTNTSYVMFYNTLYLNQQNTDEDIFELDQLAVVTPPEETIVGTDEIPEATTSPVDSSKNKQPSFKLVPMITIVILLIVTISIVVIKKRRYQHPIVDKTDLGEEDEAND